MFLKLEVVKRESARIGIRKGVVHLVVVFLVFGLLALGGIFYFGNRSSKQGGIASLLKFKKTPYESLSAAIEKNEAANTAYLDFKMKISQRITSTRTGVTQTFLANIEGYLNGEFTGNKGKGEIRISSENQPSKSITMEIISDENEVNYYRGFNTNGKWVKETKEEREKSDSPPDASVYGFDVLDALFSPSRPLFMAIKKESVVKSEAQVVGGKKSSRYVMDIETAEYLAALSADPDLSEKEKKISSQIMKDAVLSAEFQVDSDSGYVTQIIIELKGTTQPQTPEMETAGITSRIDTSITVDISRIGVPLDFEIPSGSDLL